MPVALLAVEFLGGAFPARAEPAVSDGLGGEAMEDGGLLLVVPWVGVEGGVDLTRQQARGSTTREYIKGTRRERQRERERE